MTYESYDTILIVGQVKLLLQWRLHACLGLAIHRATMCPARKRL